MKLLYTWSYEGYEILCYGWSEGEAGLENKHDLPPNGVCDFSDTDSSEELLFGDLFIVKKDNGRFKNFEVADYGEFYNIIFGGFDDCDETEDEYSDGDNEIEIDEEYDPNNESDEDSGDDLIDELTDEDDQLKLDETNY